MGSSESVWNVLVVDDEEDVHRITTLALKRRRFRGRRLELTHAHSAAEARALVLDRDRAFDVALIDVVMETRHAGLELCSFLREQCPHSLRLILRTGQPGVAPQDKVLSEYDIDYYLAKAEVTEERLYAVIRACLRSSQDIATLLAFSNQLRSFTAALQNIRAREDLLLFMGEGLKFLELKHSCSIQFAYDINEPPDEQPEDDHPTSEFSPSPELIESIRKLHAENAEPDRLYRGDHFGLPDTSVLIPFIGPADPAADGDDETRVRGALHGDFSATTMPSHLESFISDASFFIENWVIAYGAVQLREYLSQERMLREQMYLERVESIAHMVAGVAHEINTPLGVANTSSSLIRSMLNRVKNQIPETENETVEDLEEACTLLERNILRANALVRSFRQLSSSQLSDRRSKTNIVEVVNDCVASLSPELRKHGVHVVQHVDDVDLDKLAWDGYPGHLSQVVINLVQNAAKYGCGETGGNIDIFFNHDEADRLTFRVRDYGDGIDESVRGRIFEAFVTTRGTGLGLAIVHNIVTNLLDGEIRCDSVAGEGTTFTVTVPTVVEVKAG